MRYRLRTVLILLAVLPPVLWFGWTKYEAWRQAQERQKALGVWLDRRFGPVPIAIDFAFPTMPPPVNGPTVAAPEEPDHDAP